MEDKVTLNRKKIRLRNKNLLFVDIASLRANYFLGTSYTIPIQRL